MAPVAVAGSPHDAAGSTKPIMYTHQQVNDFWATNLTETKRADLSKPSRVSDSVDSFWYRVRKHAVSPKKPPTVSPNSTGNKLAASTPPLVRNFDDLERVVAEWIEIADKQKDTHHDNPALANRAGRATTNFLAGFQEYCQAFSGIAQLMDGVSYGLSSGALDVLSLFMTVAVNKVETEQGLDSMIYTLKTEYARIGRLKSVYSSSKMQEHVANVYHLGVEFLREATVYYSYNSGKRLWHVFSRPPKIDLEGRISEIKDAIGDLVTERDTLDRERLGRLESKMDSQIEDNYAEKIVTRLEKVQSLLRLTHVNTLYELKGYTNLIEDTFSHVPRLPPLESRELFSKEPFVAWREESSTSGSMSCSFLLIHGRTVAPHNSPLSWASQASMLTLRLLRESNALVAWHCCKPDDNYDGYTDTQDPTPSAPSVILSLGYRLFDMNAVGRRALGNCSASEFDDLCDLARAAEGLLAAYERQDRQPRLKECSRAAIDFLQCCISVVETHGFEHNEGSSAKVVYLIVDRFDVVPLRDTALLTPLMGLMSQSEKGTVVKVLVVGERKLRGQKGGDGVADLIEDYTGKTGWGVLEIDQN